MLDEDSKSIQALRSRGVQPQAMPTYWGAQPFTSGPVYLGALMCFLFILGLVIVDGPLKWWLGLATLFSLLISLGHNLAWFNNLIFDLLPGYNKFRTVTMSLIICQLTVPLLGISTISRLIKGEFIKERATTGLYIAGGITAGLALVFGLFGSAFFNFSGAEDKSLPDWLIGAIKDDRASLMRSDALRSLALILAGVGVVWAIINERISQNLAIGAVLVICLFDYVGVGKRFVNNDSFSAKGQEAAKFPLSPADQQILQDKTLDYRVFNTTVNSFNDASTSYHHRSVGGYHAAKLRRYQELIENHISKGNMSVLNMLNTKYIIQKGQDGQPAAGQNPNACGNAWFVGQVQKVANADEEIKALEKFDPLVTAFVDKKFAANLSGIAEGKDSSATITLTSYEPNHLVYQTSNAKDQLAVFSEIYYQPGWVATIDGKDAPIIRANYVLRAMNLPAGSHKIEMQFLPSSYFTGEKVSLASSLLILALLAFAIFKEVKGEKALA
jgi:hypothetical protein